MRQKHSVALPVEVAIFAATAAIILVSQLLYRRQQSVAQQNDRDRRSSDSSDSKGEMKNRERLLPKDSSNDDPSPFPLPSHVKREIQKEERRQKMIPKFTMKKPMYDNVFLTCPENRVLGTISNKKAEWYLQKNLAAWLVPSDEEEKGGDPPKVLRLNFTPSGRVAAESNNENDNNLLYNTSAKRNCCVACGSDAQGYARHYIVPYAYRSLFPLHFKTHLPHDIVILCPDCHVEAERHSHWRMRHLEAEARRTLGVAAELPQIIDPALKQVRTAANALLQYRAQLPAERIALFEGWILSWSNETSSDNDGTTTASWSAVLQSASEIEYQRPNPKYVTGPKAIAHSLGLLPSPSTKSDENMTEFVRAWRQHFLDVMQPRHLPAGWSVQAAVQSDRRR